MAGSPPARDDDPARLTGARAEFAASLPRRLEVVRSVLRSLSEDPGDAERKQALVRRLHALGSAARVLGFASVAEAMTEAERTLERQGSPAQRTAALADVARAIDVVPSLLLGAPPVTARVSEPASERPDEQSQPVNVLVFGTAMLAQALSGDQPIEVERTEDRARALELARVSGPNLVIIDADRPGARELVEGLGNDPLVERVPMLVVGNFTSPSAAATYVSLGAERVLPKPVSPDVLLRTAIELCGTGTRSRSEREPLGNRTVEELADRIALEVKRGLVESLEAGGRSTQVAFAEGTDVLAAVWGAIARVRELVTLRSSGTVRFLPYGPEGAVPVAPWISEERRAGDRGNPARRTLEEVGMRGRRVVVADDDPAVVWFLSDLLRAVGAEIIEAHDGQAALERTFETWPDLVISDVLMPGRDGFSLCHEVHRDVAVRDVPVILLSWKEDLLQRVRELGADANGYLRKETAASTVVERVREVLVPRARVEQRLKAGGEVRGRLDGLTPRLLLELVSRSIPDASVTFRDAVYLHEAHIRDGRVRSVSRSASDGSFERGPRVLAGLLGVNSGRFLVQPDTAPCRREFDTPLGELLAAPIARARVALAALGADSLPKVVRVRIDSEAIGRYLECTPASARKLIERLVHGASPRELLVAGDASAGLIESVLSDLARRGAIESVELEDGPLRLSQPPPAPTPPLPAAEGAGGGSLRAAAPVVSSAPPAETSELDSAWSEPPVSVPLAGDTKASIGSVSDASPPPLPVGAGKAPPPAAKAEAEDAAWFSFQLDQSASQGLPPVAASTASSDAAISELAEAVVGARPPVLDEARSDAMTPGTADVFVGAASATPPPGSDAKRGATPLPNPFAKTLESERGDHDDDGAEPLGEELGPVSAPRISTRSEVDDRISDPSLDAGLASEAGEPDPDSGSRALAVREPERDRAPNPDAQRVATGPKTRRSTPPGAGVFSHASSRPPRVSVQVPESQRPSRITLTTVAFVLLAFGAGYTLVTWLLTPLLAPHEEEPQVFPSASVGYVVPPPADGFFLTTDNLPIEAGVDVGVGNGLIEIVGADRDALYVDGTLVGRGPRRLVPSPPGPHEVRISRATDAASVKVDVSAGRRVRVSASGTSP